MDAYWRRGGRRGTSCGKYRLVRADRLLGGVVVPEAEGPYSAERAAPSLLRVVRNAARGRELEARYAYRSQVCGTRLTTPPGPYAEAAHIRPLGRPPNGPDTFNNLQCLCPNHHVLFDHGAFSLSNDLSVLGTAGATAPTLILRGPPRPAPEHLAYHRAHLFHAAEA